MKSSTKINASLISGGAICQAAAVAGPGAFGVDPWVAALLGLSAFTCALIAGTSYTEDGLRDEAKRRAERAHRTGIGSLVILLALLFGGCGGTQHVEVLPPHIEASADTRVIVPVMVGGIGVIADVACEVSVDDPVPTCGVCVAVGEIEVCRCYRGAERVTCPVDAEAEGVSSASGEGARVNEKEE